MNPKKSSKKPSVYICPKGPYLVSDLPLSEDIVVCTDDGAPIDWKKGKKVAVPKTYSLCRCGHSTNKPFCSGEHKKIGFEGTEVASKEKFSKNAEKTVGKKLVLLDNGPFCNHASFCTVGEGVWSSVETAEDKKSVVAAVKQTCNCPTGRLVVFDKKTKKEIEPKFEKSIGLIKEPWGDGPLWVKGKVEIKSGKGKAYEKRNRVCLCRCGKSKNMPFCDGSHGE